MIDLHTHTLHSDGCKTPDELVEMAISHGIRVLAITDHNMTFDLKALREKYPQIRLIQGMEVSCDHVTTKGKRVTLHVVALGFNPDHPAISELIQRNNGDRRPYVEAMLDRLRGFGMEMSYEEVCQANPDTAYYGKKSVATLMWQKGYTSSVDEALDVYIGSCGQRLAYVDFEQHFVSLKEAIAAIRAAGGICILAHLYYYRLSEDENRYLLAHFKELTGEAGGMEVYYGLYDEETRRELKSLAKQYGLMSSAGSDYHGQSDTDRLDHHFALEDCATLMRRLDIAPAIYIVSGFSGSGKGYTINKALQMLPESRRPVLISSCTTRSPRDEGDHYRFVSEETFAAMEEAGLFLETNTYDGHKYGTPCKQVYDSLKQGRSCLLEIDINGAEQIVGSGIVPRGIIRRVFLVASPKTLLKRLRSRGRGSDEAYFRRLLIAFEESKRFFDYDVFINTEEPDAAETLARFLQGEDITGCSFDGGAFRSEIFTLLTSQVCEPPGNNSMVPGQ